MLIIASHCYGATYYVSTQGNDANNGTSETTPWQTISKVNATKFQPGDSILFKGGETWNEQLNITSSGTDGNPITYSSYGNGNKPIFKGLPCGILIGSLPDPTIAVSNITISNLEITSSHWGIFAHGSKRNVEISNNYIHDLTAATKEEQQAVEQYASSVTAIAFTHTQPDNRYIIIRDNLIENGLAYTRVMPSQMTDCPEGINLGGGSGIIVSTDSKKA